MMCHFRALAFLIVASHACHDYWCDSEGKLHFYTGCPYECDHDRCAGHVEGSGIAANAQTGGCHSDTHAGCPNCGGGSHNVDCGEKMLGRATQQAYIHWFSDGSCTQYTGSSSIKHCTEDQQPFDVCESSFDDDDEDGCGRGGPKGTGDDDDDDDDDDRTASPCALVTSPANGCTGDNDCLGSADKMARASAAEADGMSAGAIAGIVVGVVLAMLVVGGALCLVCRRTGGSPVQTAGSLTSTATPDPGAVQMQGMVEQPVTPIVMATVVHESVEPAAYPSASVVQATPAMGLPVAGSSTSMPLAEMVEILKREIGVDGSMHSVVQGAAQQLGVAHEGRPLIQTAQLCLKKMGHHS